MSGQTDIPISQHESKAATLARFLLRFSWLAILVIHGVGCSQESSFNGKTGKREAAIDAMSLRSTCADNSIAVSQENLNASQGQIALSGQFCASNSSDLHVLFVLDFSQSMVTNDPAVGSWGGGAGVSCGRLRAVEAIVQALKASSGTMDQVSIGLVGFGGGAAEVIPESALASFSANGNTVCRADLGSTNYKAAFESATTALQKSSRKNKVLYFISDGQPTRGGVNISTNTTGHFNAGRVAASSLRSSVPNLMFNALLLQPTGGSSWSSIDPRQYLAELTGDSSRVRIVTEASALANNAVQLLSSPVAIEPSSVSANLQHSSGISSAVKLLSFSPVNEALPSDDRTGTWAFKTEPFTIPTTGVGTYQLVIEGQDRSGARKSTTVSIVVQ